MYEDFLSLLFFPPFSLSPDCLLCLAININLLRSDSISNVMHNKAPTATLRILPSELKIERQKGTFMSEYLN